MANTSDASLQVKDWDQREKRRGALNLKKGSSHRKRAQSICRFFFFFLIHLFRKLFTELLVGIRYHSQRLHSNWERRITGVRTMQT